MMKKKQEARKSGRAEEKKRKKKVFGHWSVVSGKIWNDTFFPSFVAS